MIKISAVNYLNTKPFVHGIQHSGFLQDYELQLDIPTVCALKVVNHEVDIGLVPIVTLPELDYKQILSNYCIGAKGKVGSVLLLSEVPLEKIENIMLDFHSNTSVLLVKVLCEKYWNIRPLWISTSKDFEHSINGTTAGILIGDRAMKIKLQYAFTYDLALEWEQFTGMPFVFACWVCNRKLPNQFVKNFEKAIEWGVRHRLDSIEGIDNYEEVKNYLLNNISYDLDANKKAAMDLFLSYIKALT